MLTRGFWKLGDISDERLVVNLKELLAADVSTEARIVAHLAELDARRLHLQGAPSLFEYCQKYLGLSDNQAYYRIAAARVARRFPIVFELLEGRAIHVTNIAPLGKYLTEENHCELLGEAGRLSKRELLKVLARRWPQPDVTSRIRKLRPAAGAVSAGPTGSLEPLSETSYRLQLNTSETLKQKLELARDLMSHANPLGDLAVVVERAVELLIEKLQSRRFGQTARPRTKRRERQVDEHPSDDHEEVNVDRSTREQVDNDEPSTSRAPAQRPKSDARVRAHIANATRRQLLARDGLGCSHVSDDGKRCAARAFLQIHHDESWAKGGPDSLDNLRLLCAAHNQLLAEQEYGRRHVQRAIEQRTRRRQRARAA